MENASKAIIIAGAIIIVIMLLGLAMAIFNTARDSLGVAGVQIDTIIAQEYNSQYQAYDKEFVTGIEVKECISEVLYNNANSTNENIFVTGLSVQYRDGTIDEYVSITNNNGVKTVVNNRLPLSNISNASRFTTSLIIGNDGLVEKIVFKMK